MFKICIAGLLHFGENSFGLLFFFFFFFLISVRTNHSYTVETLSTVLLFSVLVSVIVFMVSICSIELENDLFIYL